MLANVKAILHPTDFSDTSMDAFVHALKLAVSAQCDLHILHVASREDEWAGNVGPRVRHMLAQWKLMDEFDSMQAVGEKFGIKIDKIELPPQNPVSAVLHYQERHPSQLFVMATEGREGLPRWLHGSVAETVARRAHVNALFVSPQTQGFVVPATGEFRLGKILVPISDDPRPAPAIELAAAMRKLAGDTAEVRFVHFGDHPGAARADDKGFPAGTVFLPGGNVVDRLLEEAEDCDAGLIVMATAGHDGLMDALNGSTTEQVLRRAPCPVLSAPVPLGR